MGSSDTSEVAYVGETVEVDLESVDLEDLDEYLDDFVDLEEGETIHTSLSGGKLVVKKLRERRL